MVKRQKIGWLIVGAFLLILLSLNSLNFRAAHSTTDTSHSLSTYRTGETLPDNMLPGFSLSYAVIGEEKLVTAVENALGAALEEQTTGTATAVSDSQANIADPFLLIDLTPDRFWTPFYGHATVEAQIYYSYDGKAPWPLDEPVALQVSPAVKADGEFTVVDTTWGFISKPAYIEHLAQALAEAITSALQADVFSNP